jgi:UDP-N-acetylmuramoylalanine--D-glutamate ligase
MGKVLVLGKGVSGEAAASLAAAEGHSVEFADRVDFVVASPGVRVMSELEYGCRALAARGWKMLAVTGSKGKSSVVKIVADAISASGVRAVACGNYGRPVSDLCRVDVPGWAVVEVSSFMLETTSLAPGTFEAAAILNLQEDHLDRHLSVESYHALKRRLLTMAKTYVSPQEPSQEDESLLRGSYFDNDVLRSNGLAAAFLMRVAGLGDEDIARAFSSFEALPHRMCTVAEIDGVRYVDDSKATSIEALAAGVIMAGSCAGGQKVRLIAGGKGKGDDPSVAIPALTKWGKKVYLIGENAGGLFAAWSNSIECEISSTMDKAVEAATRDAEKGDVVLLSPGAASFDQFKNFGERGDFFARIVKTRKI